MAIDNGNEMFRFIKLIIIVTIVFLLFYVLTSFLNKEEVVEEPKIVAEIQYETILVGNVLNQKNDSYYVLVRKADDINAGLYQTYINLYKNTSEAKIVYYADLDNPLNLRFVSNESNFEIENILDLKLKETTLLEINEGKIKNAYDDKDSIKEILSSIAGIKEEKE